ncbi:MAG: GGDEF domain-containing protein, partial [Actinomycetota bacterium]|nr:GGDEF domain-containing protein [Actinomycetota bacterium]
MRISRPSLLQVELLFGLLCAVAWCLFLSTHPRTDAGQWFSNVGLVLAPLYACVCATHRALQLRGHQRWGWAALALSALSWSLGQTVWGVYESFLGREIPFPSYADLGYLGALPFLFLGLCLLPRSRLSTATRVRGVLDGLVIATALLMVSWELVLGQTLLAGSGSLLTQGIGLAYPVGDVVSATLALVLVARLRHGSGIKLVSALLLVAAVLGSAVADSGFLYLTNANTYYSGHPIDIAWFLGYLAFGFAARTARVPRGEQDEEDAERQGHFRVLAPYPAVALAVGAVAFREVTGGKIGPFMTWSLIALISLVVLRQILTSRENLSLTVFLSHQASHDGLTGLANRALFKDRVDHALASRQREHRPIAVMFLDLDGFKAVNDSYGHASGDRLLVQVAQRLRGRLRVADTIARLGGDEFGVLLEWMDNEWNADAVAHHLMAVLEPPFHVDGREIRVETSIGIALA